MTTPVHMLFGIFASVSLGQIAVKYGIIGTNGKFVCLLGTARHPPEDLCSNIVQTQQHQMRGPFFSEPGSQTCQTSLFGG